MKMFAFICEHCKFLANENEYLTRAAILFNLTAALFYRNETTESPLSNN